MKLGFAICLLVVSASSSAFDLVFKDIIEDTKRMTLQTSLSALLTENDSITFAPFGSDHLLTIGAGEYRNGDFVVSATEASMLGYQPANLSSGSSGYFTGFEFVIRPDLLLMGNWTRFHPSYNTSHEGNQALRPGEWNLLDESRASTAKMVGLNWNVYGRWQAHATLQTVVSSAWIPQRNIPRFVTQDAEDWTLAAVEVIYSF